MQKHSQYNKDERKGYERVTKELSCERWAGDWTKTATYWPPSSSSYSRISFPFLLAAQVGAWGLSLCWDLVLTPWTGTLTSLSDLQLIWTSCRTGLYNHLTPTCFLWASHLHPIQPIDSQGYPPDIFDWMHLLFTQVHFSSDSSTGSEVNMLHFDLER